MLIANQSAFFPILYASSFDERKYDETNKKGATTKRVDKFDTPYPLPLQTPFIENYERRNQQPLLFFPDQPFYFFDFLRDLR